MIQDKETLRSFDVGSQAYLVEGWSSDDSYLSHIFGKFEYKFQELCRMYLETDAVSLDIGANIGATSLIMSHYAQNGRVIAVEPGERLFKLLNENLIRNGIQNVQTFDYAVSSEPGTMTFLEHSAFGHLIRGSGNETKNLNSVEVFTIDYLVEKLELERLDFIKIDTEGFEPQVLAGAKETIRRFKPLIQFELNTWALLDAGHNDPLAFAASICEQFGVAYRINKASAGLALDVISAGDSAASAGRTMIHDNVAFNESWDDYLVCSDPEKIGPLLARVQENVQAQVATAAAAKAAAAEAAANPTLKQKIARKLRALANKVDGI